MGLIEKKETLNNPHSNCMTCSITTAICDYLNIPPVAAAGKNGMLSSKAFKRTDPNPGWHGSHLPLLKKIKQEKFQRHYSISNLAYYFKIFQIYSFDYKKNLAGIFIYIYIHIFFYNNHYKYYGLNHFTKKG